MLLTITTTASEATDLGHLLRKHPDRLYERELSFGIARVVFPEATPERCTVALAVEVDPVSLARGPNAARGDGYVTDRPYVAGSLLSVAITQAFGSALAGRAVEKAERVEEAMPIVATLSAVHAPGGEFAVHRAFAPLGYEVECLWHPLDDRFPEWGTEVVATVTLRNTIAVRDLLRHVYILSPVIDGSKHYYVGLDEVEKLIRHGEGWLATHPEREWIVRRYLRYKTNLARKALSRLVADDAEHDEEAEEQEETLEDPVRLNDQRHAAVLAALRDPSVSIRSVVDLGCGEGKLFIDLAGDARFDRVLGMDVSSFSLERASRRLERRHMSASRREKVTLAHGSLVYRDDRMKGFDAAALVEVIEHLDPGRLPAMERSVFGHAAPGRVVVTTPNREYNRTWETLPAGKFRHRDHRFEWSRDEFESWARRVASEHNYRVKFQPIGPVDPELGSPTQMALFDRLRAGEAVA